MQTVDRDRTGTCVKWYALEALGGSILFILTTAILLPLTVIEWRNYQTICEYKCSGCTSPMVHILYILLFSFWVFLCLKYNNCNNGKHDVSTG